MAVYSMTGYASAQAGGSAQAGAPGVTDASTSVGTSSPAAANAGSVTVELRSVNGRFLDIGFRLPDDFRALEPAFRDLLTAKFRRGKIELRLNAHRESDAGWPQPQ